METLQVSLFGGLFITSGEQVLVERSARLNKPLELLAMLLFQHEQVVSNEQLMEDLWGEEGVEIPAAALKNAAYSLRKILRAASPSEEFILLKSGRYLWNPNAPVEVDVWRFQEFIRQGGEKGSREASIVLFRQALALYVGELPPSIADRPWLLPHASYLRGLYIKAVLGLCDLLFEKGDRPSLEEALACCNRAILQEPLEEELYFRLFTAMQKLDMKQAVLNYYPVAANLFFDELGEKLSPPLQAVYLWASGGMEQTKADLRQVQRDLSEATRDSRPIRGAYYCEYEMFKHMYQMVARSSERAGGSMALMLVTLSGPRGALLQKQENASAMLCLKGVIRDLLRKGDVFSRYSRGQYILLLPVNDLSDCAVVQERLRRGVEGKTPLAGISMDIQFQELEPIL